MHFSSGEKAAAPQNWNCMRHNVFIYRGLYQDWVWCNRPQLLRAKGKIVYNSGFLIMCKNSHGGRHVLVGQDGTSWKGSPSDSAAT